jgi:YMGG-like Gly-zipper
MNKFYYQKNMIMKKTLSVITIAAMMAACSSSPKDGIGNANEINAKVADTVGMAEYKAWKTQKDFADFNAFQQSKNSIASHNAPRKATTSAVTSKPRTVNSGSGSASTTTSYPAKAPVKKGWSKAAKGTAIGAGGGAILGAVINKRNRAVGAVIGGVAGGAVGYGIGRHMDKKDGRY